MKTITIQIGNTDNKLTQQEWAVFISFVRTDAREMSAADGGQVHFDGGSSGDAPWQNHCIVLVMKNEDLLKLRMARRAMHFRQDSIAVTVGETEMVKAQS